MGTTPYEQRTVARLKEWLAWQGVSHAEAAQAAERVDRFYVSIADLLGDFATVAVTVSEGKPDLCTVAVQLLCMETLTRAKVRARWAELVREVSASFAEHVEKPPLRQVCFQFDPVGEAPTVGEGHYIGLLGLSAEEEAEAQRLTEALGPLAEGLKSVLGRLR